MRETHPSKAAPRPLFLRGGHVWNADSDQHHPDIRDIIVEQGRIASVSAPDALTKTKAALLSDVSEGLAQAMDVRGKLIMPGFVNAHYHSYDTLAKGLLEDAPFDVWALHSQPAYFGVRSKQELRVRTLLGAIDCLKNGVTTVQDMCSIVPQDEETLDTIAEAYREIGIRVVFSIPMRDIAELDIAPYLAADLPTEVRRLICGTPGNAVSELKFVERQLSRIGGANPLWHWGLSISGPQRCSQELLEGTAAIAARHALSFFTHVYETRAQTLKARSLYDGGSMIRHLDKLELLNKRTTLAHGVFLAQQEIDLIAERRANVIINPISNMKLKNGFAPIAALKSAGVNLALGCDNCSCGDCQSIFQVMKLFCLIAAANDPNPTGILARDALKAATIGGAAAVGLPGQIGEIREGCRADLAIFDLADQAFVPFNSAVRQMVFCETGRSLDTVIVDGSVVVANGRLTTIDEDAFRSELDELIVGFRRDFDNVRRRNAAAIPFLLEANRSVASQFSNLYNGMPTLP